jgi:hypothetical protein
MIARYRYWALLFSAVAFGNLIGWIDSRPTWDDAGITVAMVLGAATVLGFAMPDRPWLWALAVSLPDGRQASGFRCGTWSYIVATLPPLLC